MQSQNAAQITTVISSTSLHFNWETMLLFFKIITAFLRLGSQWTQKDEQSWRNVRYSEWLSNARMGHQTKIQIAWDNGKKEKVLGWTVRLFKLISGFERCFWVQEARMAYALKR